MAEGPLVHFYADEIHEALEGKVVHVQFGIKKLKGRGKDLGGARVTRVEALGKQFRIFFSTDQVILVHLLMWGSWGVYGAEEEWDKPRKRARLIIRADDAVVVAFSAPIVRLYADPEGMAESRWGNSGPDPLRDDYSRQEAIRSMREEARRPIGIVIMDQTVLAGVGNILRNEILFLCGIDPRRKVGELNDEELEQLMITTEDLMRRWRDSIGKKKNWNVVYQRSGQPCPECGTEIEFFRQDDRVTYVCPECQF